mmetsp:Transcript_52135/g.151506  ORF Transcript_52135/g.151506 Transcript_52135/m.151506 type:complete len:207 (-) Transcript_52135:101-721(-)
MSSSVSCWGPLGTTSSALSASTGPSASWRRTASASPRATPPLCSPSPRPSPGPTPAAAAARSSAARVRTWRWHTWCSCTGRSTPLLGPRTALLTSIPTGSWRAMTATANFRSRPRPTLWYTALPGTLTASSMATCGSPSAPEVPQRGCSAGSQSSSPCRCQSSCGVVRPSRSTCGGCTTQGRRGMSGRCLSPWPLRSRTLVAAPGP